MKTKRRANPAHALVRAVYADKFYPRLRARIRDVLRSQVEEFSKSNSAEISKKTLSRWSADLYQAQRQHVIAMAAHSWQLTGEELGKEQGKSINAPFLGKASVAVGSVPKDFLTRADFSAIDKWVRTTSLGAAHTTSVRLENIFRNAAATITGDEDHPVGVTPRDIARQILDAGLAQTDARAQMLAHTGAIWSYNEGAVQRYADAGVAVLEWLTADDDLRCPFCAEMNGKRVETKEPFFRSGDKFSIDDQTMSVPTGARGFDIHHPPLHPNCLTGETPVLAPDQIAAFVATYSGPIIEIGFADGRRLTVTPNHMLLTPRGFARACSLRQGDDVLDGLLAQRIIPARPNDDCAPTAIRNVVEALSKTRGVSSRRVPVSSEHLHGDAVCVEGYIDIVAPDSFFRGDTKAAFPQFLRESSRITNLELPRLRSDRNLATMLVALALAADCGMGIRRESDAFARRHPAEPDTVSSAAVTAGNSVARESAGNRATADVESLRQRELGFTGLVSRTKVAFTRIREFRGHVYDLQTASSLYLANGFISSNCRCTLVPVFDED